MGIFTWIGRLKVVLKDHRNVDFKDTVSIRYLNYLEIWCMSM